MKYSLRRSALSALVAGTTIVLAAGIAFACVALVGFRVVGDSQVEPGGTVEVFGNEFARGEPVHIRLDSPSGPILATHENPLPSTMTSRFTVEVPIPDDIAAGPHVLVATQDHYDMNVGIPARAAFYVGTSGPVAPTPEARSSALAVEDGPSAGGYVFLGLGVAALGLVLAGVASAVASRKPTGAPSKAKAKA